MPLEITVLAHKSVPLVVDGGVAQPSTVLQTISSVITGFCAVHLCLQESELVYQKLQLRYNKLKSEVSKWKQKNVILEIERDQARDEAVSCNDLSLSLSLSFSLVFSLPPPFFHPFWRSQKIFLVQEI